MKVYFFICWFLVIYLRGLVSSSPCASTKSLSVKEGENVILQLALNNVPLTSVSWEYEKHIIATTTPGQPLKMGNFGSDYTGRLSSTPTDGSLIISGLSSKDVRVYRAELFNNAKFICAQIYDLRITGNFGVSPDISEPAERCNSRQQLYRNLGDTVTLHRPSRSGVTRILWDINNIDHLAITTPGWLVKMNFTYNGRLSAMSDGSLALSGITTSDERVYRAEVFINNWEHHCTQLFDVKLTDDKFITYPGVRASTERPDSGDKFITYPTVRDSTEVPDSENNPTSAGNYRLNIVIQLSLSVFVLALASFILFHHIRTECTANQ